MVLISVVRNLVTELLLWKFGGPKGTDPRMMMDWVERLLGKSHLPTCPPCRWRGKSDAIHGQTR